MSLDSYAMLAALKEAYQGERLFRPSSIDRVMKCPGSVQLIARSARFRRGSSYAREGTAAHRVAEMALNGERQPEEWGDTKIIVDNFEVGVDDEMVEAIGGHVDIVREMITEGSTMLVEQFMSLSALDPTDPVMAENGGTADVIILNYVLEILDVVDLKYGKGVMVSADAPQLKDYAVLAVLNHPGPWKKVRLTISQPRAINEDQRLKTVEFDIAELMSGFLGELMQAMDVALSENPPLVTGTHCRWCAAKDTNTCPQIRSEAFNIGRDEFQPAESFSALSNAFTPLPEVYLGTVDAPVPVVPGNAVVLPPAVSLDPAQIATILAREHLWDTFIKGVKQRACQLIEAGTVVPGWMMSPRAGHRKFKLKDKELETELMAAGIKLIEMYAPPKFKTPAQMEKVLKPKDRALLAPMVDRPWGEPVLMPATEGRTPISGGFTPLPSDS